MKFIKIKIVKPAKIIKIIALHVLIAKIENYKLINVFAWMGIMKEMKIFVILA